VALGSQDNSQVAKEMFDQVRGAEVPLLLEKLFGDEATEAANALAGDTEQLIEAVSTAATEKAEESLAAQIKAQKNKPTAKPVVAPKAQTSPAKKPAQTVTPKKPTGKAPPKPRKSAFYYHQPRSSWRHAQLNWRQGTFGFQLVQQQNEAQNQKPDIK
jgi:hypothetical protein